MKRNFLCLFFCLLMVMSYAQQKITFIADQIIMLTPQEPLNPPRPFAASFDGNLTTSWHPGYGIPYPSSALADLYGTYTITKIRCYGANNSPNRRFLVYGGPDPVNLTLLYDKYVSVYNQWVELSMNVTGVKFLKFEVGMNANPAPNTDTKPGAPQEVEVYGIQTASNPPAPTTGSFKAPVNVNGAFGINGFTDLKKELYQPFTMARLYIDADWMEYTEGAYMFNPVNSGMGGGGMMDKYLDSLTRIMRLDVMPCIQGNLKNTNRPTANPTWDVLQKERQYKPVNYPTADSLNPASYSEIAQLYFQFAARYGSTVVDPSLLVVNTTPRWTGDIMNVKKSGLGYVKYMECWNEPDKGWFGIKGNMTPFEYAAYLSAAIDGHCNTMGPKIGIKNADPKMKVVIGGLTTLNVDYIKGMILWFKTFRPDHSIPVDVFNVHFYSNAGGAGVSPESVNFRDQVIALKSYLDLNAPGKELFVSEYGYDTNTGGPQRTPAIGTMSSKVIQGIWNVRSMLDLMAAQVDRTYVFQLPDGASTETNSGLYTNSGVVTSGSTGFTKKPAYYYLNTLNNVLKDYKFVADESPNSSIRRYKFVKGSSVVYALWLTSSSAATASYSLSLPGITTGTLIKLLDQNLTGDLSTIAFSSGTATIPISESPVFVRVSIPDKSALSFDGVQKYAQVPFFSGMNTGNGDFTYEARIKASTTQSDIYPMVISNRNSYNGFFLMVAMGTEVWQQGKPWVQINGTNYPCSNCPTVADNNCHHIAITRKNNMLNYYVDGSFYLTRPVVDDGNISNVANLVIGHDVTNPSQTYFNGTISEVRVWNVARDVQSIATYANTSLTGTEAGLIGYWKLNEGSGQTLFNSAAGQTTQGFLGSSTSAETVDPAWSFSCSGGILKTGLSDENIIIPIEEEDSIVYPNPFHSGELHFGKVAGYYLLTNGIGEKISEGNNAEVVRLSNLTPGIYTLKLDKKVYKIVIQ